MLDASIKCYTFDFHILIYIEQVEKVIAASPVIEASSYTVAEQIAADQASNSLLALLHFGGDRQCECNRDTHPDRFQVS